MQIETLKRYILFSGENKRKKKKKKKNEKKHSFSKFSG